MALPQDGQDANGLTKVTQIPAGKELMFIDPTTNEGGIITLEDLTKQILNGLTSQTFGLDSGTQTLPAAINYLYGNTFSGRTVKIEPKGTITVTYNRYTTASIFSFRKGMYLFSNGYITTIKQDDQVSVSISTDYKTITFKNQSSVEWAYGVLLLSDSNPTITSLK